MKVHPERGEEWLAFDAYVVTLGFKPGVGINILFELFKILERERRFGIRTDPYKGEWMAIVDLSACSGIREDGSLVMKPDADGSLLFITDEAKLRIMIDRFVHRPAESAAIKLLTCTRAECVPGEGALALGLHSQQGVWWPQLSMRVFESLTPYRRRAAR